QCEHLDWALCGSLILSQPKAEPIIVCWRLMFRVEKFKAEAQCVIGMATWGAGAGPNSTDASQPIPLAKFCRNFRLCSGAIREHLTATGAADFTPAQHGPNRSTASHWPHPHGCNQLIAGTC